MAIGIKRSGGGAGKGTDAARKLMTGVASAATCCSIVSMCRWVVRCTNAAISSFRVANCR